MVLTSTVLIILSLLVQIVQVLYLRIYAGLFNLVSDPGVFNLVVDLTSVIGFLLIALAFLFSLLSLLTKGADRSLKYFNILLSILLGIISLDRLVSAAF